MSANTLSSLSASEIDEIAARNPGIFAPSPWRRLRPVLIVAAAIVYALYCWWFFAIGKVLGDANWDIAGNYLADWISYEVRPDFEIAADGAIELSFPRFSPLGANPDPDWIAVKKTMMMRGGEAEKTVAADKPSEKAAGFGFMVPDAKGTSTGGTQVQTRLVIRFHGSRCAGNVNGRWRYSRSGRCAGAAPCRGRGDRVGHRDHGVGQAH